MLTKHHGLGNDFLVAIEPDLTVGPDDARRWCDRRRGVGADGLIIAARHGEDPTAWRMQLWNADGSAAELSGNGLRCLGQALVLHHDDGQPTATFTVHTDAGVRTLEVQPDRATHTDTVEVAMGVPRPGPAASARWPGLGITVERQLGVDMGNPHLVALVPAVADVDLATVGPAIESDYPDGVNVEVIELRGRDSLSLRVWERGAGITEACGTGACAAVWAARTWGLVDDRVEVVMPGGTAGVRFDGDAVTLSGPATFVAVVEIEQRG
ncbi:MAG: diaminopimelate epimerase [Acidimicrobiales bacterium]